jgi:hypothetical protein
MKCYFVLAQDISNPDRYTDKIWCHSSPHTFHVFEFPTENEAVQFEKTLESTRNSIVYTSKTKLRQHIESFMPIRK